MKIYKTGLMNILLGKICKNALIFCENIKNLNGVLSCVFNNLHLKIKIL